MDELHLSGRLFTNSKNNSGPSSDSWGTPDDTISLTENNVVISGRKKVAEFFNSYFVHIDKMMDGYIISVAYGVYGNLRLQRKMKKNMF